LFPQRRAISGKSAIVKLTVERAHVELLDTK
jgi:hypothetical protein